MLRLTSSTTFAQNLLLPQLPEFRARSPEILLDCLFTDMNVDLVAERIDLAIRLAQAVEGGQVAARLMSTSNLLRPPDSGAAGMGCHRNDLRHLCLAGLSKQVLPASQGPRHDRLPPRAHPQCALPARVTGCRDCHPDFSTKNQNFRRKFVAAAPERDGKSCPSCPHRYSARLLRRRRAWPWTWESSWEASPTGRR